MTATIKHCWYVVILI